VAITGSLPILDWNQGLRHRAQAQGVRAQARLAEVRQQIQIEVESSLRDFYHVRALRLQRAQPLHERRARALDLTRKLFAEGLASFGDVVMASRDLFSARRTLLQLERDALVARWRLAVAVAAW
jgi:outer membrane protein TolC